MLLYFSGMRNTRRVQNLTERKCTMNELERKCFRCLVCDVPFTCPECEADVCLLKLCPAHPSYVRTQLEQERYEAHLLYYAVKEMAEEYRELPVDADDPPAWACDQDPTRCSWHGVVVEQYGDSCPVCDFQEECGWIDDGWFFTWPNGKLHAEPIFKSVTVVIDMTVEGPDDWSPAEAARQATRTWLEG